MNHPADHRPVEHVTTRAVVVWLVAVLAYVVAVFARSSLSATGVEAAVRFSTTASSLSMFTVLQLAVYAAMQIPAGTFLDRRGARASIVVGCLLIGAGQAAIALATTVPAAVGARVLVGGGDAFVFISVMRLLPAWFPPRTVPLLTQLTGTLGQLGQLVSLAPLVALLHARGWTAAFLLAGSGAVLVAALVLAVVRDGRARVAIDLPTAGTERPAGAPPVPAPAGHEGRMRRTWRDPGTRAGYWAHFVAPFPASAFVLLWGFPYMTRSQGVPSEEALHVLDLYVVAGLVASVVIGTVASRAPHRKLRLVLTVVTLQVVLWGAVLAWPGHAPTPLLLALAVPMACAGGASLIGFDYARETNELRTLGLATGMVNTGGFTSTLLTVLLVGLVLDLEGEGTPELFTDAGFTVAWLVLVPLWTLGTIMLVRSDRALHRARPRVSAA